jgi:hypothetical protein
LNKEDLQKIAIAAALKRESRSGLFSSDGQFRSRVMARSFVSGTMTFIRKRSPLRNGANWPRLGLSPSGGVSKRNSGRDAGYRNKTRVLMSSMRFGGTIVRERVISK